MKTALITSDTYKNHNTGDGHPEKIDRVTAVIDNFKKLDNKNLIWKKPSKFEKSLLIKTHSSEYIDHVDRSYPQNGFNFLDGDTVVSPGSKEATMDAVGSIIAAIDGVEEKEFKNAFCAVRPPGHHASKDLAGGYCYLNNAAIAAQYYLDHGANKVAILDIDYHHGNGSQNIFYERADVLFTSLHCRPEDEYPFLLGYQNETGLGAGENFNFNFPMPLGTTYTVWEQALVCAIKKIKKYAPEVIVVSLGVDTFIDDPVGGFKLFSEDFLDIGKKISQLRSPTHFVMEGGYAKAELGINVSNVISGFVE